MSNRPHPDKIRSSNLTRNIDSHRSAVFRETLNTPQPFGLNLSKPLRTAIASSNRYVRAHAF
jgi:hypothetical protein